MVLGLCWYMSVSQSDTSRYHKAVGQKRRSKKGLKRRPAHSERNCGRQGYEVNAITRYGQIEHEILAVAKSDDADLIVVGTHGRRGIDRLLCGSEAEALIYHFDGPVLTVGPRAEPPRASTWLLKEIICAAAPGTHSAKAAAYGYRLAQENGAYFTLFYAEDPGSSPSPGWLASF